VAINSVSAASSDNWQLISSVTASGSSVSFTPLTGYKRLMVSLQNVTKSSAASFYISFNSDTSTPGNYSGASSFIVWGASSASPYGGLAFVENINQSTPHLVSLVSNSTISASYNNPVAITSVQIWSDSPAGPTTTFSGGTIAIYGIAA